MNYKVAKYVEFVKCDKFYLAYGMLSKSCVKLTIEQYSCLSNRPKIDQKISQSLLAELLDKKIVVSEDCNELSCLKKLREKDQPNKIFTTTIIPTADCNFKCPYCFEKNKPLYMANVTADKISSSIISHTIECDLSDYYICWFGGEPLLNMPVISRVNNKIRPHFQKIDTNIRQILVTNGSLLTKDVRQACFENEIQAVQITLDGSKVLHDIRRPKRDGSGTFAEIVENIVCFQTEHPEVYIYIRVNLDKQNKDHIEQMLKELKEGGLKKKTQITYEPVGCYGEKSDSWKKNTLSMKDFAIELKKIRELTYQYGFQSMRIPKYRKAACQAVSDNGLIINADGFVYKCLALIGQDKREIGHINNSSLQELSQISPFPDHEPLENKPCMDCSYLPLCMGGCPLQRQKGLFQCSTWRYTLKDDIEMMD